MFIFNDQFLRKARIDFSAKNAYEMHISFNLYFVFKYITLTFHLIQGGPLWRSKCRREGNMTSILNTVKVKLSSCLIKHHAMKTYKGAEVQLSTF
jgi:endo-1,4-beta-D-glucanase Y